MERVNELIRGFPGGDQLEIHGSVLVVKTDHWGVVRNVDKSDAYFIQSMLVEWVSFLTPIVHVADGIQYIGQPLSPRPQMG